MLRRRCAGRHAASAVWTFAAQRGFIDKEAGPLDRKGYTPRPMHFSNPTPAGGVFNEQQREQSDAAFREELKHRMTAGWGAESIPAKAPPTSGPAGDYVREDTTPNVATGGARIGGAQSHRFRSYGVAGQQTTFGAAPPVGGSGRTTNTNGFGAEAREADGGGPRQYKQSNRKIDSPNRVKDYMEAHEAREKQYEGNTDIDSKLMHGLLTGACIFCIWTGMGDGEPYWQSAKYDDGTGGDGTSTPPAAGSSATAA